MTFAEVEVSCDKCEGTEKIPVGQCSTKCSNDDCNKDDSYVLLAPAPVGKKYVSVKCQKSHIRCIDVNEVLLKCQCCDGKASEFAIDSMFVEVRNGQKIYGTTEATPFIKRRCKERKETRERLYAVGIELQKMGANLPEIQPFVEKTYLSPDLDVPFSTTCDNCGTAIEIPAGKIGALCENEDCEKKVNPAVTLRNALRPIPKDLKYVFINCCEGKPWTFRRHKDVSFVTSECCKKELVIDSVVSRIVSNQVLYATVRTDGFIKRQYMQLAQIKQQLVTAEALLEKLSQKKDRKPSMCKRIFTKTVNIVTGKKI